MGSSPTGIGDITVTLAHGTLRAPEGIENQVQAAVSHEGFTIAELGIVLTDHDTVTRLNELHLNRSYVTDVLAFDYSGEMAVRSKQIDGEVFVDLDTALERAPEFGVAYDDEVRRYVLHGVLHLMGYRDDKPDGKEEMRRLENLYLG
ncbi:rRNA maturation RNase YbeY [Bacteroidota bacterium]